MYWLCWILGILALLLVWLCLTRVGIRFQKTGDAVTLRVQIGLISLQILPKKERAETKKAKETGARAEKTKQSAPARNLPKPTLRQVREILQALAPPLKRALRRTRRGIRIHPLRLSLTLGGREDPAAAAELYGYLHTGIWTVMPQLERLLEIPDPRLHVGMDFDMDETVLEGEAALSIRIGTLLAVGCTAACPMLGWFIRYRRERKKPQTIPAAGA